jgi:ABC-2 type transport system ATP-binding protein
MLSINNLTKKFGAKTALDGISISIKPGEIFSLIGPNGSGKTTLIKTVAGLLQPNGGSVLIGEYDIVKNPEKAKSLIGYIPDEPSVWQYMTGGEFLHFTGAVFGINEGERSKILPGLLDIFKLKGIENQSFEEYSRGNKQKFSILAALLHKPRLLLIDEPIVGLDPISAEIAKHEFVKFTKNGGSILLVTHTLSVAEEISDRIGILSQGRLSAIGTMEELRSEASLPNDAPLMEVYQRLT